MWLIDFNWQCIRLACCYQLLSASQQGWWSQRNPWPGTFYFEKWCFWFGCVFLFQELINFSSLLKTFMTLTYRGGPFPDILLVCERWSGTCLHQEGCGFDSWAWEPSVCLLAFSHSHVHVRLIGHCKLSAGVCGRLSLCQPASAQRLGSSSPPPSWAQGLSSCRRWTGLEQPIF